MTEKSKNDVPQIAITAYESNEDDIEVTNLFNTRHDKINNKIHGIRSVSPKKIRHTSKIILKSPIATHNNVQKSLSPGLSDLNNITDVEIISDSDDEKYYIHTPNLTPGPIDYFILTDVEDLSEDEGQELNNKVKNKHTITDKFTDDKKNKFIEKEQTESSFESLSHFPQPHKEILYHSKDGVVHSLAPTEKSNSIWLKSLNEEVNKGFKSEEEIIINGEYNVNDSYFTNHNTYYHDIDVGVETVKESIETAKHEKCKHKYKNRVLPTKKVEIPKIECGKKKFRNKSRCNSEIEENVERCLQETKKKSLSNYISEPTLNKIILSTQEQNDMINTNKHQEKNNKLVIHDNRNGFSISIDFESHHSILLNIGRDYENLSMKWFNNGLTTGSILSSNHSNLKILEKLEPGYFIKSSLYDIQQQFEVDLFTYCTMKTLHNSYLTYIYIYPAIQPVNIVQLYINKLFQIQIKTTKYPLVKIYSLKDKFTNMEILNPSPVTCLSAFKLFNNKKEEKLEVKKKIEFQSEKNVSDVIHIFENMINNPKLEQKFDLKNISHADTNIKKIYNFKCSGEKNPIGKY